MVSPLAGLLLSYIEPFDEFTAEDRLTILFSKVVPNAQGRFFNDITDCLHTGEILTRLILGGRIAFESHEALRDLPLADEIKVDRNYEVDERIETLTFKGIYEGYKITHLMYKKDKLNKLDADGWVDNHQTIKNRVSLMGLRCSDSDPVFLVDHCGDPVDFNRKTIELVKKKIEKLVKKRKDQYYFNFMVCDPVSFVESKLIDHRFGLELWFDDPTGNPRFTVYQSWVRVTNLYRTLNKHQSMNLEEGKQWLDRIADLYSNDGQFYPEETENSCFGYGKTRYVQNRYVFNESKNSYSAKTIFCHFGKFNLLDVENRLDQLYC